MKALLCTLLFLTAPAIVAFRVYQAKKAGTWTAYEKRAVINFFILVTAAVALIIVPVPDDEWGLLWLLPVLALIVASVAMAIKFPSNSIGDWLHRMTWGKAGATKIRQRPGFMLQIISGAMLVVLTVVFWGGVALWKDIHGSTSQASNPNATSTAPATPAPATSKAPDKATPTQKSTKPADTVKGQCGDELYLVTAPRQTNTSSFWPASVQRCVDGKWQTWSGAGPSTITVTYAAEVGDNYVYQFDMSGKTVEVRLPIKSIKNT